MSSSDENNAFEQLNRNLEVVIALLLRRPGRDDDGPTARQQIATLTSLGVRPRDIARILGRSATYVNKELVTIRKTTKRKASE